MRAVLAGRLPRSMDEAEVDVILRKVLKWVDSGARFSRCRCYRYIL
jgi:hypothetical protein